MPKFATIRVEEINAKETVEQLVIDGVKQLEIFEFSLIGTTYLSEYRVLLKYIEHLANGNSLPESKFRHLKGTKDGISEYEFKSKHLRVYTIQMPSKKLIVFLGFKNTQASDITAFRALKVKFLQSQKIRKNEKK